MRDNAPSDARSCCRACSPSCRRRGRADRRPDTRSTGATMPSLKFSARLSIAARATPCRSRRAGSRPTIWLTAMRPASTPPSRSAKETAATCRNRPRCATRMPISSASISAPTGRPRHSAWMSQPIAAAPPTSTSTATTPRSRRTRSVRCCRFSLRSTDAIGAPGEHDRMRQKPEYARHVAEHRVDRQAGEQQQQRIVRGMAASSRRQSRLSRRRDQPGAINRARSIGGEIGR